MAYDKEKKVEDAIWKLKDGAGYLVELRLGGGYGERVRRTKKTLADARYVRDNLRASKAADDDFSATRAIEKRKLMELIDLWYEMFGVNLKDGKSRYGKMKHLCTLWGNPRFSAITPRSYMALRQKRIDNGSSLSTVNHDLAYFRTMFNKLVKAGELRRNPIFEVDALKTDEPQLTYLEFEEIQRLMKALSESISPDVYIVSRICLETGCRIGEAMNLERRQVANGLIHFTKTKNSTERAVPISVRLELMIKGDKSRPHFGRMFAGSCARAFRTGIQNAGIYLPGGQLTHVMRHTFAVHFMREKGSIFDLQKILGHKTLKMTLRYAKFHPDYLADAIHKNPIAIMEREGLQIAV